MATVVVVVAMVMVVAMVVMVLTRVCQFRLGRRERQRGHARLQPLPGVVDVYCGAPTPV